MTLSELMHSYTFLQLGQAISHDNRQAASMALRRLENACREAGFDEWKIQLAGLRGAIAGGNKQEALQILTIITNKRVQWLKREQEESAQ